MDLQGLWFRLMLLISTAWLWVRDLTNWKALGLATLIQIAASTVLYTVFYLIFGFQIPGLIRLIINISFLYLLLRYFDNKFPQPDREIK